MLKLHCHTCHKFMAEVRDASIRSGMVVYCAPCNTANMRTQRRTDTEMPDFLEGLFKRKKSRPE